MTKIIVNKLCNFTLADFGTHVNCTTSPILGTMFLFFFIGNTIFFEKMNIMFMMMNTLDMKKIQKAQELKLTANKL